VLGFLFSTNGELGVSVHRCGAMQSFPAFENEASQAALRLNPRFLSSYHIERCLRLCSFHGA